MVLIQQQICWNHLRTGHVNRGCGVDYMFLDYQKAFDTVPHQRLLKKFEACGVTEVKVTNESQDFLFSHLTIHFENKNFWLRLPQWDCCISKK